MGGGRGCLGIIYNNSKFKADAGVKWVLPQLQGTYPAFPSGATLEEKKKPISEFIKSEMGLKTAKVCKELLKGMHIKPVDENFILELFKGGHAGVRWR